jgi:hypothetical protein
MKNEKQRNEWSSTLPFDPATEPGGGGASPGAGAGAVDSL